MPHSHTQQDAEQLSRPIAGEGLTRNAHGQSLDDAREAFRTAWEQKLRVLREQAKQARRRAESCRKIGWFIFVGGPVFGAYFGAVLALLQFHEAGWAEAFVAGAVTGSIFGLSTVVPFLLLVAGCWWRYRQRAQRLERELQKLERL